MYGSLTIHHHGDTLRPWFSTVEIPTAPRHPPEAVHSVETDQLLAQLSDVLPRAAPPGPAFIQRWATVATVAMNSRTALWSDCTTECASGPASGSLVPCNELLPF